MMFTTELLWLVYFALASNWWTFCGLNEISCLSFQGQDLTLQFLFFDGEEPFVRWSGNDNTYGSRHLAKVWQEKGLLDGIEVFMLLDLLGARNPKISPLDGKPHVC